MATILETLENAQFNFNQSHSIGFPIAKEQLSNAILLLEKGYGIYTEVEPLIEYGLENIPDAESD